MFVFCAVAYKKGGPAGCFLPADMKKKYFKKIIVFL